MPRHLIGDAHEWINEIPTVPTYSLAKLQPSQRSWDMYFCRYVSHDSYLYAYNIHSHCILICRIHIYIQQRGKKTLLSLTLIYHCHLVSMEKIVRGSIYLDTRIIIYNHETPLLDDLADLLYHHCLHILLYPCW